MKINYLLLVDDNEIDNLINKKVVLNNQFAAHVDVVKSVEAAINYLVGKARNDQNLLPELIFLDIRMPEQDGFDFLESFQNLDMAIRTKCQIVMLSSSIDPEDHRRATDNPYVVEFINKPLTASALQKLESRDLN